ncbi:MAG: DinB family protein [Chitinophagales bacterium]
MTIIEVTKKLNFSINLTVETLEKFQPEVFFERKNDKWSPAEQAQHLVLSVKPLLLAYSLPKIGLRLLFGKPNRPIRSYEQILEKYHVKLAEGATASSAYVPKQLKTGTTPEAVINTFVATHQKLIAKISNWKDEDLDHFLLPHPLLGKITLREMLYFTDFHILHHNDLMHKIYLT